jgi:sialate O-acetylesterase
MMLQQSLSVAIWGAADPGEAVAVSFRSENVSTVADKNGRWLVRLAPQVAGGPHDMIIQAGNTVLLRDILVGEVWICSGQSNMEWPVSLASNPEKEIAEALPEVRLFTVKHDVAAAPQSDFTGSWSPASPDIVKDFSAVGFFFGRELHRHLNVPVGLIDSSWGGTPAESWTTRETLESDLSLNPILWQWKRVLADYPGAQTRYERQLKEWEEISATAKAQGKTPPQKPASPRGPGHSWTPAGLYNAMIAPMTSFAIRGALWYQGESNAAPYRAYEYRRLFQAMISDWRKAWNQGPFPFLFVQLANFMERKAAPAESAWAELREAQTMALSLPNTGMAAAIDIGEADDIHPRNKQEVGRRLALAARSVAYGEKLVYSGPMYRGMIVEGRQIRLRFQHVGQGGLASRDGGKLEGFAIAGRDRKFVWADARIDGETVVVSSAKVQDPVAVRYGWADNPACNLVGKDGLPASPFRTDDWPGTLME